jgi:hypothetical protein
LTRSTHRVPLGTRYLSWGSFPFSVFGGWSLRDLCQPVPPGQLRSVLRLSQPLDGLLLHPPSTPFGAVTLVGFSLQGFPLSNRPKGSSPSGFPSWHSSRGVRTLLLERREPWAQDRPPRKKSVLAFCCLQGVAPFESPCRAAKPLSRAAGRSPPGLSPPEGLPVAKLEDFHPRRSCASRPPAPSPCLATQGRSRRKLHSSVSDFADSATLSREQLPFRGFPPSVPHPCEVSRFWLIALRLSPWVSDRVTATFKPASNRLAPYLAAG